MSITQIRKREANANDWLKVKVGDLVLGMFVVELDRPWRDTPFPINGFHLRNFDDIQSLRILCEHVYIDTNKGAGLKRRNDQLTILSSARKRAPESAAIKIRHDVYPRTRSVKQEVDAAARIYQLLNDRLTTAITSAREHNPLGMKELYKLANATIDSVMRNPDAFIWYLNTSDQGACILKHSIRGAIWATIFAVYIGFKRDDIEALCVGTLLADIGMAKFSRDFVAKRGAFKRKEYLAYQKHVGIGVDILRVEGDVDPRIISIVRSHHERHDGRGFPKGQRGDQISSLARIANLAYSYERLLKHSSESDLSPATAISRLYKQRKLKFAEQLVFEFIKALGMFPAGTVVELVTGEVGIVIEQNPNQRLTPKIMVVTTARKQIRKECALINQRSKQDGESFKAIKRSLPRGTHRIDPQKFTERVFGKRIGIGPITMRIKRRN